MWVNKYIGIPFKDNGRDRDGLDCWGLYRLVVLEMTGVNLPLFDTIDSTDPIRVRETMEGSREQWVQVPLDLAQNFDLVHMRSVYKIGECYASAAIHVGCYFEPRHVLHTERRFDSVAQHVNELKERIVGVYRHRDLVEWMSSPLTP